jgi:hypothetical protein
MLGLFSLLLIVGGLASASFLAIENDRTRGGEHDAPHGHH